MATIRQIAREAKVSIATVSRILDADKAHLVYPDTRRAVEKVIQKHGYIPNMAARALSRKKSDTLGMVTPFSTDVVCSPYFTRLISGIIAGIRPLQYDLKWIMIRDEERQNSTLAGLLQKHMVDGLVFLSWRLLPALVEEIERKKTLPLVLINDFDDAVKASIVYSDNETGVRLLMEYLKTKGYRRIAVLRGPEWISADARLRFQFISKFAASNRLVLKEKDVVSCAEFSEESGKAAMKDLLRRGDLPDVIVGMNDLIAAGAMKAAVEAGLKIPEDIAFTGYDGFLASDGTENCPLTTVEQPLEEMGRRTVEILGDLISRNRKKSVQVKLTPRLRIGRSA